MVKDVQVLSTKFLPQYFKHNQFSSFARQLNFYGFQKEKDDCVRVADCETGDERRWHFSHEHFLRGKPERLSKIIRKVPKRALAGKTKDEGQSSNDDNGQNDSKKEYQSLKSEIASLETQLIMMESNIDHLSKTLNSKLKINREGSPGDQKIINGGNNDATVPTETSSMTSNTANQHKRLKATEMSIPKEVTPNAKIPLSKTNQSTNNDNQQTITPSMNAIFTKHPASSDLPDVSMASHENVLDKSFARSTSSQSAPSAPVPLEVSSEDGIGVVDDIFASFENNLRSTIDFSRKDDDEKEVLTLPTFDPSFGKVKDSNILEDKQSHQSTIKRQNVHQLMHNLSASQRKLFVNKILTEAVPNNIYEKGSFHGSLILIDALERILSLDDGSKKHVRTTNGYTLDDKNKNNAKSSVVKIED